MAHQNLMFDTFHTLDNAQASFMLGNPGAYNAYAGNHQQYSNDTTTSFSGNWDLTESNLSNGFNSSSHPRSSVSHSNLMPLNTGYIHGGYSSYTPPPHSSPSYALSEPQRPHTGYQSSHSRVTLNPRSRSDEDIAYSGLPVSLPDVSNNQHSTLLVNGRSRGVTWESRTQGNPLQNTGSDMPPEAFGWSPQSADTGFFTFDSSWSDSMSSPMSSPDVHVGLSPEYNYSLEVSPVSPPQPRSAAAYALRHVSPTSSSSSPPASRRGSVDIPPGGKVCSHCHATSTPLWRREPNTLKPLCNACGLYLQQRNRHRPQELIDADAADDSESDNDGSGPECSHCHTHHTSVWRRSKTGAQLCNACGVYSRLRGRDRPLSLKRNRIKPRSKHSPTNTTTA
ncbi:putative zinc finger binding to DNA consensus sequence [AT]GATA[AG] [Lyophyllum shimeji]|uniref:Zinc finger binding to DNA consensus sequence [AT]GATA[AG] n=1 Tax=Lyophyllum shimeji TaxID=47721 RepID=A0A9P3PEE5_LYOSH|nr:putative zinc finger binding to DNA consensus sequence [AT]GATA[AG] [Lyophyllum shimeji]